MNPLHIKSTVLATAPRILVSSVALEVLPFTPAPTNYRCRGRAFLLTASRSQQNG